MKVKIFNTPKEAGAYASETAAELLNEAIAKKGVARIVLSTGASQFPFFDAIIREKVDWSKVEMFHLDEYIGIEKTHKASFVKYLEEKFTSKVSLKAAYFVNGKGDIQKNIAELTKNINKAEIDVALIGIGENAHIAFNDPPADFESDSAYKIVDLDQKCKAQQVGEGWFADEKSVCSTAMSMTCKQIMKCKNIISLVPYSVKANAVKMTLESEKTNLVPATLLKEHKSWILVCDKDSAALISPEMKKLCS